MLLVAGCLTARGAAQEQTAPRRQGIAQTATQLERQGRYEEAARAYREILVEQPTNVSALLGLERVFSRLGWLDSLSPYVVRAVAVAPRNRVIRELEFRVVSTLFAADSVAAAVARWIVAVPESPDPYRQWAFWLARQGDLEGAKSVLAAGRERLGDASLAQYTAQLLVASGDWLEAARQWITAVVANDGLIATAGAGLGQAPRAVHEQLLKIMVEDAPPPGSWLAADLLVRWGRPEEGWTLLDSTLPRDRGRAMVVLRRFTDRARMVRTVGGARARGYALERLADLSSGVAAERARLEAAQAFADAGNLAGAQRMLNRIGVGTQREPTDAAAAMATLIRVLADAGRADEAEEHFQAWESRLSRDDVAAIKQKLAWSWVMRGELERADRALAGDSSIGAQAVLGWVALYRGDLAAARERFRVAGPYAQSREEATRRAAMLVLLERVQAERLTALGEAVLMLARGDTARAVQRLEAAAGTLAPSGGRSDVLAFAGGLASESAEFETAERLLLEAIAADSAGPSAATATYALAVVHVSLGRNDAAIQRLEHLILTFPESAVVPQARRLLDQVRGMIPRS